VRRPSLIHLPELGRRMVTAARGAARRVLGWWHGGRVGARWRTSLLAKAVIASVVVMTITGVAGMAVGSHVIRQQMTDHATHVAIEQTEMLASRLRAEARSLRQLMDVVARRVVEAPDGDVLSDERVRELLEDLRAADGRFEIATLVDPVSGRIVASSHSRATLIDPGPLDAMTSGPWPETNMRVVPTSDGGHAVVHVLPVIQSDRRAMLIVAGYQLNGGRARQLNVDLGTDQIDVVVAGQVVASSGDTWLNEPLGDPTDTVGTQWLDDDRLVRYVKIGSDQRWATSAAVGLIDQDPLRGLAARVTASRVWVVVLSLTFGAGVAALFLRRLVRPIKELTVTASAIAEGDLGRRFDAGHRRDEIGALAAGLDGMRVTLRQHLAIINEQAVALRRATRRAVRAQDRERQRIARDLHDGIQQQLVVLRMEVGRLMAHAAGSAELIPQDVSQPMQRVAERIDELLEQLRSTGQQLFPSILQDRGLGPALFSLAGRSEVRIHVATDPDDLPRIDQEIEVHAYFLVAEAVTNALKHASPTTIKVSARIDANTLTVQIVDDGVGFAPAQVSNSGGIGHMDDRVRVLGGSMDVVAAPGSGTRIVARFPLDSRRSLQKEEHRGDPSIEVDRLGEPELPKDRVGVLLNRTL